MTNKIVNFLTVRIDETKCTNCHECINHCPTGALGLIQEIIVHNAYECNYEKECEQICENNAIEIKDM